MINISKSALILATLTLIFAFLPRRATIESNAATVTIGTNTFVLGPGDSIDTEGNIISLKGDTLVSSDGTVLSKEIKCLTAPTAEITEENSETAGGETGTSGLNYTCEVIDGVNTYIYEGSRYTLGADYGVHKISGYTYNADGTAKTYSGKTATPRHTVSVKSDLPIGTVILVEGVSGAKKDAYNGMYVVEDRGGTHIENEGWIDMFFASRTEAMGTTALGWNEAKITICNKTN